MASPPILSDPVAGGRRARGSSPGSGPLGLYVHLPWCVAKCPYCDFNSHALKGDLPQSRYLEALAADLAVDARLIGNRVVDTVFIGGGTPSLFSPDAIARLLESVNDNVTVARDAEITLEANPGTVEFGRFARFRQAGVNRLSIGVQSFDDNRLAALGRIHDGAQARRAVDVAGAAGFDDFNIDIMFGLPGQSVDGARDDLEAVIASAATHVSFYQLTIEPNTMFHARPPALPDEDDVWTIQCLGRDLLADAGYAQYEVSAFCQPGRACRHNLNYWRFGDYLGVGAGAHGKVGLADGRQVRYFKERHPARYMETAGKDESVGERRVLGDDDLVFEYMLNALRLESGFDAGSFTGATGLQLEQVAGARLEDARQHGLMECRDDAWWPTELGKRFLNDLQAMFLGDCNRRSGSRGSTLE